MDELEPLINLCETSLTETSMSLLKGQLPSVPILISILDAVKYARELGKQGEQIPVEQLKKIDGIAAEARQLIALINFGQALNEAREAFRSTRLYALGSVHTLTPAKRSGLELVVAGCNTAYATLIEYREDIPQQAMQGVRQFFDYWAFSLVHLALDTRNRSNLIIGKQEDAFERLNREDLRKALKGYLEAINEYNQVLYVAKTGLEEGIPMGDLIWVRRRIARIAVDARELAKFAGDNRTVAYLGNVLSNVGVKTQHVSRLGPQSEKYQPVKAVL